MKVRLLSVLLGVVVSMGVQAEGDVTARGKYLVAVGGCNDCHTAGYAESGGSVPEAQWLAGVPVGYRGPWGVTYPGNLRLLMQTLSPEEWLVKARTPMRPPMPSPSLMVMTDEDLLAIYAYIKGLGPAGNPMPNYLAPGERVATPYYDFVPKEPSVAAEP